MTIQFQPPECFAAHCPLAGVASGFALDAGDPSTAKLVACCEAPGGDEVEFRLDDPANETFWKDELIRRRAAYPDLAERFIRQGAPVAGKSGQFFWSKMMGPVGLRREHIFVQNVLRCKPPKIGDSNYPTGETRKEAEACCRMWDRHQQFKPDTAVITIHPAALVRDITPLPLAIEDCRKARDFAAQGRRVMLLVGDKAAHRFAGTPGNITYWRGNYAEIDSGIFSSRQPEVDSLQEGAETAHAS